ncbi:transglycosylase domain-containing protein [Protaetiibacter intestinalis]|uniref:PASTA domain-containing protein n=1 Tax=Protaetiibacter intestinalis TaxID=2419774 RepID=A0A387B3P3_9MICO|nr:transglycosylase domain-containing protein [Protaetiibacter intestinalis]AYF98244.1 PASTA domain-containing protein [Protaetiibacter intestinalis]
MPAQGSTARSLLGAGLGLVGFSAIAGLLVTVMVAPAIAVTGMTANNSISVFQDLPDYISIEEQRQRNEIVAISADGVTEIKIADIFDQNREEVSLDQMDEDLKWAAIDGEDRRFYEHGGVDVPSVIRAAIGQATGTSESGASTLSMQLVRNILILKAVNTPITEDYTEDDYDADIKAATYPDLNRKLKEMKLAISLEKKYTKDEILQAYLNIVLMGGTTYGVQAGAQRYFGVDASDLTPAQAASLVAIVQNPSKNGLYSADNFAANQARRDVILGWMHTQGHLSDDDYEAALATPVDETTVGNNAPRNGCTSAPVEYRIPCDYAVKSIKNGEVSSLGVTKDEQLATWQQGGLKVVLTITPEIQGYEHQIVGQYAPATETRMQLGSSVTSVEVGTGRILAMAQNKIFDETGNGDPQTTTAVNFAGDVKHGAATGAQPGSTYKPFVLLAFLASGHGAMETFNASIREMPSSAFRDTCNAPNGYAWDDPKPYTYKNDSGETGLYTAVRGTAQSVNSVFVQMAAELDQCEIRDMARSFGMHDAAGALDGSDMETNPACSIGGCENNFVSSTMAAAYAGIANQGTYCAPIIVDNVFASDGMELGGQQKVCNPTLASPAVANTAAYAMAQVMSGGTGSQANPRDGVPYIGKTGTANKAQNTWMVGSTTRVATAVWVGNIVGDQSLRAISINGTYGGNIRHAIFKPIAKTIDAYYPGGAFPAADPALMTGTPVIVPDNLVGSTPEQAKAAIELAKLSYVDAGQMDSDLPVGTVVKTDPASGSSVPKGTAVNVFTSNGQAAMVPDVVTPNQSFNSARDQLEDAGFENVDQVCVAPTSTDPPSSIGKVVAQNPSAGSVLNKSTHITLTVREVGCPTGGGPGT